MELVALFAGSLLIGLVVLALIVWVCNYPGTFLAVVGLLVLIVACQRSEAEPLRFEVGLVIESADDRAAADEAVRYAAGIFRHDFSIELAATVVEVDSVAQHTHAGALLDALKLYRFEHPTQLKTDATVLLTRREMTRGFQGVATVGPACSASAAAVVTLRSDGYDGQIVAHELLHTLGVPHDHAAGYLMSESVGRAGSDYASPDTVLTVKAAPLAECMAKPAASVPTGTPTAPSGGGGSFDIVFVFALFALACAVHFARVASRNAKDAHDARLATVQCSARHAPEFSLRDLKSMEGDPQTHRHVTLEFHTVAGAQDFVVWLMDESRRARAAL